MKKLILSAMLLGIFFAPEVTMAQTETSGRETVYRATAAVENALVHTKLKVGFDFDKEHVHGEEWLTAAPHFYATNTLELDAKGMLIHEVALEKKNKKTPLKFNYTQEKLTIQLDKEYQKDEQYTVYIKYTARPSEVKQIGSAAITDAKGLYFINAQGKDPNKPTQIWTQGETESSSAWFPTIDKPNQKTTQEIYITVPDKYITLSNGLLKNSSKTGNNLRTDYWVMDKKHAPYLFFIGVGEYAVVRDRWKNIAVDYYVEKEYEPYAKQIFGMTPEMLDFFSNKLNYPYPWQKYAQITARDYVSGAMENTTAVLHSDMAQQKPDQLKDENRWEDVIAHELFHHWFGDLVTTESWSNLTINESFANYSEYLWNEYKYGKDLADYGLMRANQGYFLNPENISKDLVRFNYHSREDMFDAVSYNKGGAILHMLRNYLGDKAFFASLTSFLKVNEYGTAEAHQLRLAMEKVSGKDLNWFFNQWFFGSGHPTLSYTSSFDPIKKAVTLSIHQSQNQYFQFPLVIDFIENGKAQRHKVWVDAKAKNDFVLPSSKNPEVINVNADGVLLSEIKEQLTPAQATAMYQASKDFLSRYRAIKAVEKMPENDTATQLLVRALKDSNFRIRVMALNALDLSQPAVAKRAISEVEQKLNDDKTLVVAAALSALAKTKNAKYASVFEKNVSSPLSFATKAAGLEGLVQVAPEKVEKIIGTIDLENASENIITSLLPVIINNKVEKQLSAIASTVAFYPFIKFQDPKLGALAEKGFHWMMTTDNSKAIDHLTKILGQVKGQLGGNPQAKMMILNMLKEGVQKKMETLKQNPNSISLQYQVEQLNKTITSYQ
ncbi:M1 family metallopeptidase [Bergeyella zoohelcum]|uniref:Aminopeptidase N n=1 Tax=Bergeyella zoohelcum ATCC 43767 TaxID=883096 RepID=K1LMG6_9FLAO|nr:M1 family metallopeptidase [Bergeyella zoohelcum]EKB58065.1 hypothetical protein HMPREF9699_00723 [Bergeyella zoohelcum ATCC 43767]SUV49091.1 Aminopeptidase N [Bergeyella zoohelcum]